MSSVPPNLVGPILQTNLTQRQVSNIRDNEQAQRSSADRKQSSSIDEKDTTVETTDDDTQVYTDSEGSGSQGRAFSQSEELEEEVLEEEGADNVSEDQGGRHLDLEA